MVQRFRQLSLFLLPICSRMCRLEHMCKETLCLDHNHVQERIAGQSKSEECISILFGLVCCNCVLLQQLCTPVLFQHGLQHGHFKGIPWGSAWCMPHKKAPHTKQSSPCFDNPLLFHSKLQDNMCNITASVLRDHERHFFPVPEATLQKPIVICHNYRDASEPYRLHQARAPYSIATRTQAKI